jgi:hypothetical protein
MIRMRFDAALCSDCIPLCFFRRINPRNREAVSPRGQQQAQSDKREAPSHKGGSHIRRVMSNMATPRQRCAVREAMAQIIAQIDGQNDDHNPEPRRPLCPHHQSKVLVHVFERDHNQRFDVDT